MARNEKQVYSDISLERGLPSNLDAERFVLGATLQDDSKFTDIAAVLDPECFTLESHRRIYLRMGEVSKRGEHIDRVTVANELVKQNQLESVGGLTYLVSLDEGLPTLSHIEDYARIVREKFKLRQIIFSSQSVIERALNDTDSAEEIAGDAARGLVELSDRDGSTGAQLAYSIIEDNPSHFFSNSIDQESGLKTGLTRLDEMTGGLQKQDLIIIAARPSMGKTALLMNIAAHAAIKDGAKVGIWSLEMTKRALLTRIICGEARVDLQKFRAGYLSTDERARYMKKAQELKGVALAIEDRRSINIVEIHASARKVRDKHGLDLIGIDYLQLVNQHTKTDNRARALGEITKYIKTAICSDLDVPVILLSQLNREPDKRKGDHRPELSDLKESGSIEEDADVVAFCYRPEYYDRTREELKGLGEVLLRKQRNGPVGTVKLVFMKEFTKWENRANDSGKEGEE